MINIRQAYGLTDRELRDIEVLERACCRREPLHMKLNWEMLSRRDPNKVHDFLYYEGDVLLGFAGLYCIGDKAEEIEMTGMVHPDCRRRGIFSALFAAARQEAAARGAGRLLLVTEKSSPSAKGFINHINARYDFSEYRMKFEADAVPSFPRRGILLRKAEEQDMAALIEIASSEMPKSQDAGGYTRETLEDTYVIEKGGDRIGRIGIMNEGVARYIFGFIIKPEHRGKGYGREALSLALMKCILDRVPMVLLEVAVKNPNALALYTSCGFEPVTVYDYYELAL